VIKLDKLPDAPLASSRWRTLPPATKRVTGWARADRERCRTCAARAAVRARAHFVSAWRAQRPAS
jgi:hypothetical protein